MSVSDPLLSPGESTEGQTPVTHRGLVLAVLVAAQFIVVLDFSVVQIALPTIRSEFGVSLADIQWLISAYGLTFAGFLLLSGRASDIYGRRRLFTLGLLLFSSTSLAAGLAPNESILIAARTVQGIAAAVISATGLSLIVVTFAPIGQLNRVLGIVTAVSSAGFTVGVILGGILTETLGWRSVFFINVPIGIIAAALAPRLVTESRGNLASRRLDVPGAVSVTAGLMLLVYALSSVANGDLNLLALSAFGLASLSLAAFVAIEYRSAAPLVPLSFVRRGVVFGANAMALLSFGAGTAMIFMLTIYLQQLREYAPLTTAVLFIPPALIFFIVGGFMAARIVNRFGVKRVLVVSMVLQTASILLLTRLTLDGDYFTTILPAFILLALGGAPGYTAIYIAALGAAKQGEEGLASGMINTSGQIGGPIGLAIVVTIIGVVTRGLGGGVSSASQLITGFQFAFAGAAVLSGATVLIALRMREPRSKSVSPVAGAGMPNPLE